MTWQKGHADIGALVSRGHLERVVGEAANGEYLLAEAELRLTSARTIREADPVGAFELVYESLRHAATALLVQQGLRTTSEGGHIALCDAVRAQFGEPFDFLNRLRAVRNDLEYPRGPGSLAIQAEVVKAAFDYADDTLAKVEQFLPAMTLWQP